MSSLPVPVSPWISTVESVGETRSTCSSTASRAGLLPTSCSNLRSSRSLTSGSIFATAPTESLLGSTLHSCPNAVEQGLIVERFGQELHRARSERLQAHFSVAVGSDEDGGYPALLGVQPGQKLQTGHSRHADIGDQTRRLLVEPGLEEFFSRGERARRKAGHLQQALHCVAN